MSLEEDDRLKKLKEATQGDADIAVNSLQDDRLEKFKRIFAQSQNFDKNDETNITIMKKVLDEYPDDDTAAHKLLLDFYPIVAATDVRTDSLKKKIATHFNLTLKAIDDDETMNGTTATSSNVKPLSVNPIASVKPRVETSHFSSSSRHNPVAVASEKELDKVNNFMDTRVNSISNTEPSNTEPSSAEPPIARSPSVTGLTATSSATVKPNITSRETNAYFPPPTSTGVKPPIARSPSVTVNNDLTAADKRKKNIARALAVLKAELVPTRGGRVKSKKNKIKKIASLKNSKKTRCKKCQRASRKRKNSNKNKKTNKYYTVISK
jgi:hypothetical protein